jgi:hypothetical protein
MTYITGTVGASANPGADLYALLAPALTSAGYTLVDTVVISTRTHKVWKCAAANNSQTLDWYLDVAYPTSGAGNMTLLPMEFYDPATHLAYRFVYGQSTATLETTFYSRFGASGFALEDTTNWPVNASNVVVLAFNTSTAAFGYWISVTGDRVAALSSVLPGTILYVGMCTAHPLHVAAVGASAYPLLALAMDTTVGNALWTSTAGSVNTPMLMTRAPKLTTIPSSWGSLWGAMPAVGTQITVPGPASTFTQAMGVRVVCPIWVMFRSGYGVVGTLIGVTYATSSTSITRGDTVTIGADTWVTNTQGTNGFTLLRAV